MKKKEKGVMVMKGDAAWGEIYSDGRCKHYGWTNPASHEVKIADPKYCKKPTDFTYEGSEYFDELSKGKLVPVTRITKVYVGGKGLTKINNWYKACLWVKYHYQIICGRLFSQSY